MSEQLVATSLDEPRGYCKTPCKECPWRKDNVGGVVSGEKIRAIAFTAYTNISFQCHMKPNRNNMCAGAILANNHQGRDVPFDIKEVRPTGLDMFRSMREMAIGYGIDPEDEALRYCE